jgi:flagellar protein FlbD
MLEKGGEVCGDPVIELTRLNNQPFALNSDLIKFVENAHDTVVTLVNDEKLVVRESVEEVIERIVRFRRSVLSGLPASADGPGLAGSLSNPQAISKELRAKGQSNG